MSDIKCYYDYNSSCYRDLEKESGEWYWDGSYIPMPGRNVSIFPNPHCVANESDYKKLKAFGFSKVYVRTDDFDDNGGNRLRHLEKAQLVYSNADIVLMLEATDTDMKRVKAKIVLALKSGDQKDFYGIFLDEPHRDEVKIDISDLADTIHALGQKFFIGEFINEYLDIGPDYFNEEDYNEADSFSYTRYVRDWTSGDQRWDWLKWKSRYGSKAEMPWVKLDYLEGPPYTHQDIRYLNDYLLFAAMHFRNVGAYSLEILQDVSADLHDVCIMCSYAYPNMDRKRCKEIIGTAAYAGIDNEVYDYIFSNDSNWMNYRKCICNRDFKPSEYHKYLNLELNNPCGAILEVICQVYWRRLAMFRDAAIAAGILKRNVVWRTIGRWTERYYCQFGDCAKCNNRDVEDKRYWDKNPLPMCPPSKIDRAIRKINLERGKQYTAKEFFIRPFLDMV